MGVKYTIAIVTIVLIFGISLCTIFPQYWETVIIINIFICLIILWLFSPQYILLLFFGHDPAERTNAKILKYIGVICGSLILFANLISIAEANKINAEINHITKKGQLDTRFKDAALLLASENTVASIAGVYALHQIAIESSNDRYQQHYPDIIANVLTATIRKEFIIKKNNRGVVKEPEQSKIVLQTILDCLDATSIYRTSNNEIHYSFSNSHLTEINTDYQNLFVNSDLSGVYLVGADLTNIDLTGADLTGANLTNIDLSKTILRGANLSMTILLDVSFKGSSSSTISLVSEDKLKDKPHGLKINKSRSSSLTQKLNNADSKRIISSKSNLSEVLFHATNLAGMDLSEMDLSRADLTGANLTGANLTEVVLTRANLTGANLTGAILIDTDLTNVDLTDVVNY